MICILWLCFEQTSHKVWYIKHPCKCKQYFSIMWALISLKVGTFSKMYSSGVHWYLNHHINSQKRLDGGHQNPNMLPHVNDLGNINQQSTSPHVPCVSNIYSQWEKHHCKVSRMFFPRHTKVIAQEIKFLIGWYNVFLLCKVPMCCPRGCIFALLSHL